VAVSTVSHVMCCDRHWVVVGHVVMRGECSGNL